MKNFFEVIFKRNIRSRNCSKSDTSVQNKSQIEIASDNKEFVCTACLRTAKELYQIFKSIARDEDCGSICEQYAYITGSDLDE